MVIALTLYTCIAIFPMQALSHPGNISSRDGVNIVSESSKNVDIQYFSFSPQGDHSRSLGPCSVSSVQRFFDC